MSQHASDGPKPPELRPAIDQPQASPDSSSSTYREKASSAQFYSAPPTAQNPKQSSTGGTSRGGLRMAAVATVAAVGIVAGLWFGFSGSTSVTPPPAASAGDQLKTFTVSAADVDAKATAQLKAILAGGAAGAAALADDDNLRSANAPALKAMAENNPQMAEEIASGKRVLYRVFLLDFLADDGDHAELFVNGASQGNVKLKNEGVSYLIPLAPGLPAQMKLVATADGGGGVTVAFVSSLGEARTRVMQAGEAETWQVIVQ